MATNTTTAYAAIIKQEKLEDGTLLVHGKATDDSLDIDQQICDATWLNKAMPEWFKTGGNIREQHSNIAAGVAKELDSKKDGHYITALVVDPVSVKKVENGVLKGFSIGIRAPRIVRDEKAANGRIIDGQIVEVSLVDRPANPNAKLMLAKCDNEQDLVKVEEYEEIDNIEKHGDHDQSDHNPHGGGGSSSSSGERDNSAAKSEARAADEARVALNEARDSLRDIDDDNAQDAADSIKDAASAMDDAYGLLEDAQNETNDGGHTARIEDALDRLGDAQTSIASAQESMDKIDDMDVDDISDEVDDINEEIVEMIGNLEEYLDGMYGRGDKSARTRNKEQVMENNTEKADSKKPSKKEALKRLEEARKMYKEAEAMCKELGYLGAEKDDDEELEKKSAPKKDADKEPEADKKKREYGESAEEESEEGEEGSGAEHEVGEARGKKKSKIKKSEKCLECGCHKVGDDHGGGDIVLPDGTESHMTSATVATPKSTILPQPTYEDIGTVTGEDEEEEMSDKTITAIIAKAVKSAKESVTAEIISYKEEINKLQDELATARSKAVAGGPKRTVIKTDIDAMGDLLAKAAEYRAKSAVTSDKDLARGYKELADDFEIKAKALQAK